MSAPQENPFGNAQPVAQQPAATGTAGGPPQYQYTPQAVGASPNPQVAQQPQGLPGLPAAPAGAPQMPPGAGAPPSPFVAQGSDDDFSVDMSNATSGNNNNPRAGNHVMRVADVVKDISRKGNNMFVWDLQVVEGDDAGKVGRIWTALSDNALWKLAEVMGALGIQTTNGQYKFTKQQVVGIQVIGVVIDDVDDKGRPRTSLDTILAHPKGAGYRGM